MKQSRSKKRSTPLHEAKKNFQIGSLAAVKEEKKVGFTSFFPRFAGSDVLIQCISTITHSIFEPDFVLEQRSTLNSGCLSRRMPVVFL